MNFLITDDAGVKKFLNRLARNYKIISASAMLIELYFYTITNTAIQPPEISRRLFVNNLIQNVGYPLFVEATVSVYMKQTKGFRERKEEEALNKNEK